jgi:hypothetical protein
MNKRNRHLTRLQTKGILLLGLLAFMPITTRAQVTYERQDSLTISRLLKESAPQTDVLTLARSFLNVPYVAHTLEVNDREQLVVNTRQLDCTTLVETVAALKLCLQQGRRTWDDYVDMLRTLRYRGGKIDGYPSRLHYFSDWIRDKARMQLVEDVQLPNKPFSEDQHIDVSYMSEHPQAYKALRNAPDLVPVIRQQEQALTGLTARFIPKTEVTNTALMRRTVKDGDIIAITCNKPGLDIAHLGFAVWRANGLHLLNASQIRHKVVEEPMSLRYYLSKHPTFTGIRIVRINSKLSKL